jgi:hypothetical protein
LYGTTSSAERGNLARERHHPWNNPPSLTLATLALLEADTGKISKRETVTS